MRPIEERLDEMEVKIQSPSFRKNSGLGNEVGYYIFDYLAEDELTVRERIAYIKDRSSRSSDEFRVIEFDLYDIAIKILKEKNYFEKCFELEKKKGISKVSTAISNLIRLDSTDGLIVKYIKEHTPPKAIVFLTGIGKCYPFIRSHKVLNNLHQVVDGVPVVMFYPGRYNLQDLLLFGEIEDGNYYRAFRLIED